MTKILFISHGINDTGWGQVTRNTLNALRGEFDVVSRTIEFQPSQPLDWFMELQSKAIEGTTHVLQYVLPHHLTYFPNVKNIGIVEIENADLNFSTWTDHLNKMDEVWVSNYQAKLALKDLIYPEVHVVNHCLDLSIYEKDYPKIDIPEVRGTYKFYYIADHLPRKNLPALIKAFHTEFDSQEPVSLIIKCNDESVKEFCIEVKKSLQLYPDIRDYIGEIILSKPMTNDQIYSLHKTCDCYVSPAAGESWGQPVFDSQGFGNVCVVSEVGGHLELENSMNDMFDENQNNFVLTHKDIGLSGSIFVHDQNARTSTKMCLLPELKRTMRMAYDGKLNNIDVSSFSFENYNECVKTRLS